MVKRIKIGKLNINIIFRHKWDEKSKESFTDFRNYEIGLWYRKSKMVSTIDFQDPKKWGHRVVGNHMIGINLLVCKSWITIDYNGKYF
jgi:hypothetical protein